MNGRVIFYASGKWIKCFSVLSIFESIETRCPQACLSINNRNLSSISSFHSTGWILWELNREHNRFGWWMIRFSQFLKKKIRKTTGRNLFIGLEIWWGCAETQNKVTQPVRNMWFIASQNASVFSVMWEILAKFNG